MFYPCQYVSWTRRLTRVGVPNFILTHDIFETLDISVVERYA